MSPTALMVTLLALSNAWEARRVQAAVGTGDVAGEVSQAETTKVGQPSVFGVGRDSDLRSKGSEGMGRLQMLAMLLVATDPAGAFDTQIAVPRFGVSSTGRMHDPQMAQHSRREALTKLSAAALGANALADRASAKAGEFGKVSFFGSDISSPYQPGGPKSGADATYGYAKSDGQFLAEGYETDVAREKLSFLESARRLQLLQPQIEDKKWWYLRDELRAQAYNMRQSMTALNAVSGDKAAVDKAYKKYWLDVEQFDLACAKKDQNLVQKKYTDLLDTLSEYKALV